MRDKIYQQETSLGRIGVAVSAVSVTRVFMPGQTWPAHQYQRQKTPLHEQVLAQLEEYAAGERRVWLLPLDVSGTCWQQQVWAALRAIPYGQTLTYRQLAGQLGRGEAVRAVSQACVANPLPILIPSHRVVTQGGQAASAWARQLLALERRYA